MRRAIHAIVLSFAVAGGGLVMARPATAAVDCAKETQSCRADFAVGPLRLPLYVSQPLDGAHRGIARVLIMVHGADGNADGYFGYALAAAAAAHHRDDTMVVAPQFIDWKGQGTAPAGTLTWDRRDDWRGGDESSAAVQPRVSSFAVMDRLVEAVTDRARFPDLVSLVIAGHSAGGQFVQRYALLRGDFAAGGPPARFVVANPSSYLYLDARRPDRAAPGAFRVPANAACAANRYKYGLDRGNAYVAAAIEAVGLDGLAARYRQRDLTYLLGGSDTDPNHRLLDKTCAAEAQGPTRLARGLAFEAYMNSFFAPHAQRFAVVPNVGHNASRMFRSREGIAALFPE